ncbi:zinc-binding dehydrogenase [Brevibacterium sp. 5221]|uniref:Zinc-binding dehydrogenase n=1 Tax=Brevibacterium rongguiense TaxID=2695267 RepID=A0A6N9H8K2_9MICO|nr:NAD(P)H-quinone oxidoreductase [Brevibacterium rongguiense]MYM20323.1 zinc-binding dehydrogenase [Brevibacterium rongguiense]
MRAITIAEPGGPEVLAAAERPVPTCPPGSVLVRVAAVGVNRADILQRQGHYSPPAGATDIPGLEVAGTIAELGEGVSEDRWSVGDRVAALLTGGGYAEYVDVPEGQLLAVPDSLSLTEAAALPEVLATVYSNVFQAARLRAGEWLLVHGGGSGIGTAAIQLAKTAGAQVAVTVGSARKGAAAAELGADAVIDYREEDFVERIRAITDGRGADVILDVVGAKYLQRNVDALADDGRLVIIGMQGGVKAELNIGTLMAHRRSIIGTTLRARPDEQKAAIVQAVADDVWPLVARGRVRPVVYRVVPFEEAGRAHALLEDGESIGKVVVAVSPLIGADDQETRADGA